MSHKSYKPARSRLQRSELAVPGSSPQMFEKALNSAAELRAFSNILGDDPGTANSLLCNLDLAGL